MRHQCAFEHRKCINFGFEDWPAIEIVNPENDFVKPIVHLTIIYVARGAVRVSFGVTRNHILAPGDMMLFPPGVSLEFDISRPPVTMVVLKVKNRIQLCDKYVFGNNLRNMEPAPKKHIHLRANSTIERYMDQLVEDVAEKVPCFKLMEIKILELFYYLKAFYSPTELAHFIQPLLSTNTQFMYFIWNNYREVRSVKQFAKMANCSLSAFKIKFKNATGMSPSRWMNQQRARNVFHEISRGEKTLKQISEDYHFSSVSHMGTFCRKNFGKSPGAIKPRQKNSENGQDRQTYV